MEISGHLKDSIEIEVSEIPTSCHVQKIPFAVKASRGWEGGSYDITPAVQSLQFAEGNFMTSHMTHSLHSETFKKYHMKTKIYIYLLHYLLNKYSCRAVSFKSK